MRTIARELFEPIGLLGRDARWSQARDARELGDQKGVYKIRSDLAHGIGFAKSVGRYWVYDCHGISVIDQNP